MTYASSDPSFGRSTSTAAARGGALIAVAVVIGFLLLWQGGVGGSGDDVSAASSESDSSATDETETGDETPDETETGDAGDGGSEGDAEPDETVDPTTTEATTDTVAPTPVTRPPGEVKVAVANGTNTNGLAGARSEVLATAGYTIAAVNAAADTAMSAVYYVEGYGNEAEAVANELGGDATVLRPAPTDPGALVTDATQVEGFHIFVVLGTDAVLG